MRESTQVHRVLILDDDEVMRELLEALLSMQGYSVRLADSGTAALSLLRDEAPFDLVLTDLQLPELSGRALAEQLRTAAGPNCLLLGMSGRLALEEERRVLDGFLTKPFDMAKFEAAVQSAQSKHGASPASDPGEEHSTARGVVEDPGPVAPPLNEDIFGSLAKTLPVAQMLELYDLTLTDVTRRHARMQELAAAGDLEAVQREAHAVKGACGMVGASELQALSAAAEGGTTINIAAISEFPAACMRLRRMLDAKLQTA